VVAIDLLVQALHGDAIEFGEVAIEDDPCGGGGSGSAIPRTQRVLKSAWPSG
jgi:hypothetical protein